MVRQVAVVVIALMLLPGCKKGGPGIGSTKASLLAKLGPAIVPEGWTNHDLGTGFTLALPPGWKVAKGAPEAIKKFTDEKNANAWDIMDERKADVDLNKTTMLAGFRQYMSSGYMFTDNDYAEQSLVVLRETRDGNVSPEEAVSRWQDTLFGGSSPPRLLEGEYQLEVGLAKTLTATSTVLGTIEKTTVYFLVDGNVQYTFFFAESAQGKAEPIPTKLVMETFRPTIP